MSGWPRTAPSMISRNIRGIASIRIRMLFNERPGDTDGLCEHGSAFEMSRTAQFGFTRLLNGRRLRGRRRLRPFWKYGLDRKVQEDSPGRHRIDDVGSASRAGCARGS